MENARRLIEVRYWMIVSFFSLLARTNTDSSGINAGIMVIRPSNKVFSDLLKYAESNPPMVFWPNNQVGCTEQVSVA